jgi:hypothetical protein
MHIHLGHRGSAKTLTLSEKRTLTGTHTRIDTKNGGPRARERDSKKLYNMPTWSHFGCICDTHANLMISLLANSMHTQSVAYSISIDAHTLSHMCRPFIDFRRRPPMLNWLRFRLHQIIGWDFLWCYMSRKIRKKIVLWHGAQSDAARLCIYVRATITFFRILLLFSWLSP